MIGFVTAINSAGTFVPGTTGLDAATVTDTYTDGDPANRATPAGFLIDGRKLFIRPKSNEKGLFRSKLMMQAPTNLSADDDSVFNELWGNAIAIGTAAEYWQQRGDIAKASDLVGNPIALGSYAYMTGRINKTWALQQTGRRAQRAY